MIKEFKKRLFSSLILIPIVIFFIFQGSILFSFFLGILFLVTSYEWLKMSKKNNLLKFLGIIFLIFSFYTAFQIRESDDFEAFLFIVIICISTDIGGYMFGKIFKGPKLIRISPQKTYAGVFGGFILSLIAGLIFTHYFFDKDLINLNKESLLLFIMILFISFVSQVGKECILGNFLQKLSKKSRLKFTKCRSRNIARLGIPGGPHQIRLEKLLRLRRVSAQMGQWRPQP